MTTDETKRPRAAERPRESGAAVSGRGWRMYRPSGVAFGPRAVNDVRRDDPDLLEPVE